MNHLDSLTPTLVLVTSTLINHVCKENKELSLRDVLVVLSPSVPTLIPILVSILKSVIAATTAKKEEKAEEGSAAGAGTNPGGGAGTTTDNAVPCKTIDRVWQAVLAVWQHVMMWLGWKMNNDDGDSFADSHMETEKCDEHWVPRIQMQQVECTEDFMRQLSVYLNDQKNKTCFYNVTQHEQRYKIQNAASIGLTQIWSNIRIQIPLVQTLEGEENTGTNVDAAVEAVTTNKVVEIELDKLSVNLTVQKEGVRRIAGAAAHAKAKREIDLTKITRLSDFIDDEEERKRFQAIATPEIEKKYCEQNPGTINAIKSNVYVECLWDVRVVQLVKEKCPKLDIVKSLLDAIIMLNASIIFGKAGEFVKKDRVEYRMRRKWIGQYRFLNLFGHIMELDELKFNDAIHCGSGTEGKTSWFSEVDNITQFPTVVALLKQLTSNGKPSSSSNVAAAATPQPTTLTFTLPTPAICPDIDVSFQSFLISIQNGTTHSSTKTILLGGGDSSTTTAKIKIYNLAIERKEVRSETPNPAYAEYEEKREQLSKLEKGNNEQLQFLTAEFLRQPIPPKIFVETNLEPQVSVQLVNEKSKRFDTLYLRELDLRKLHNVLNRFKTSTDLFETYGLPNKLGILLHGEPGTGKTSAIHAIATFLQKNIYYTNLSNVETNVELQMLFDHVQQCSIGGGIIVFEDIDAMTHIVHRREPVAAASRSVSGTSTPETQISRWSAGSGGSNENTLITLEYLLNLMQGSLTRDGTIFIATTNHKEKLDPALCRVGRFDVDIEMKKCDHYQIQTIYKVFLQRPIPPALLRRIPEDQYTPAEFIFHCVQFIKMDDVSDETILAPFLEELTVDNGKL